VANLTDTNASLTQSLARTTEKLIAALTNVTTLTKQLSNLRATNPPTAPRGDPPLERKHYCWTCGYRCTHCSWNFPTPAAGHQKRAKVANTMNGSVVNKPS
jgi:hypothetical protein